MINKDQMEKLLHDLKRASKAIELIRDEENENKRHLLAGLITDELDRLHEDLEELTENGGKEKTFACRTYFRRIR